MKQAAQSHSFMRTGSDMALSLARSRSVRESVKKLRRNASEYCKVVANELGTHSISLRTSLRPRLARLPPSGD
jgi:hypothetical protein